MWTNSAYERVLSTPESKNVFYASYDSNTELLDVIANALSDKLSTCDKAIKSVESYTSPAWAYKQADANGYKRALTEVIQLLTIRDMSNDRTK